VSKNRLARIAIHMFPFIVIFCFFLAFHQTIRSLDADDVFFSHVQQRASLGQFLIQRYEGWSGRLTVEAAMYVVRAFNLRWWRLINALVITGLCFLLTMLALGDRFWLADEPGTDKTIWFACLGIGLINIQVLGSGLFWVTGSFNYLWPITAACVVLVPFRRRLSGASSHLALNSLAWCLLPILAAVFAGMGNEQVSLILVGLTLLFNLVIYRTEKKVDGYLLSLALLVTASFIVLWTAPGNRIRYEQEIVTWYPNFRDLSFVEHALLTLQWLLDKVINVNRLLMILLFGMIALSLKHKPASSADRFLTGATAVLGALLAVASLDLEILHPGMQTWITEMLFTFHPVKDFVAAYAKLDRNVNFILYFIPYLLWIPALVSTPYLIFRSWSGARSKGLLFATLFCAAIFSLVMMAFSPTLIASANRIVAVFSLIVWFLVIGYFAALHDRIPAWALIPVLLLGVGNLAFQYLEWSHKYFIRW
jgi:hypothetical protein